VFFDEKLTLTASDVIGFLSEINRVDINARAYNYTMEFISMNINKFNGKDPQKTYGELDRDNNKIYVIKSKFNEICDEGKFNPKSFLSWLHRNKKIDTVETKVKRINGVSTRCVVFNEICDHDLPYDWQYGLNMI